MGMSNRTPGEIAVVKPYYATEEAYRMGHRFASGFASVNDETVPDDEPLELSYIKESAKWANNIAPDLRAMAGMSDPGHGTYTGDRQVAAVRAGCEEDQPAEAELMDARRLFRVLSDCWDMGARDAYEGTNDPDSTRHKVPAMAGDA